MNSQACSFGIDLRCHPLRYRLDITHSSFMLNAKILVQYSPVILAI